VCWEPGWPRARRALSLRPGADSVAYSRALRPIPQDGRYRRGRGSHGQTYPHCGRTRGCTQTVIDVGANDGADSLPYARQYPAIRFIAVEPTPELARRLESESDTLENYTVVGCAIGRADGEAIFNIRRSSVHNSLEAIDESNVARAGITLETYEVLERVRVPVRTLESLCDDLRVERIDVLHIDAQGSDMDVLISAGRLLQTVRAGVVEVRRRLSLYSNSVGRRDFIRFLSRNGLQVVTIEANDPRNWEQNLFFTQVRSGRHLPRGDLRASDHDEHGRAAPAREAFTGASESPRWMTARRFG
jgi:FkbM family methyltransferase